MGAEKHPLLVSTSELFLPRDGQRRKPETTLPRAQPQHSGLKSLPSLSPSTPTARAAAVQVHPERRTKGSIRHDTFWHWQSQDSGMVLVPTVQSVRCTRQKQTRSIKQAGVGICLFAWVHALELFPVSPQSVEMQGKSNQSPEIIWGSRLSRFKNRKTPSQ